MASISPLKLEKKLTPTSERGIFLGYGIEHKAYKVYNPVSKTLIISPDVHFNETPSSSGKKSAFASAAHFPLQLVLAPPALVPPALPGPQAMPNPNDLRIFETHCSRSSLQIFSPEQGQATTTADCSQLYKTSLKVLWRLYLLDWNFGEFQAALKSLEVDREKWKDAFIIPLHLGETSASWTQAVTVMGGSGGGEEWGKGWRRRIWRRIRRRLPA
ncbi:uncharacterized protein LOC112342709 [Selaginella moellendorffii]|uniref:uncharacterized protein LOC112342709 n=1 Tax=Selaginella moellendorffii TaxID=88036 RepID=UPI000D1CC608|nr:uncharacterized protein LOC112342709 [Selaginella moellendorffii]|eukprot:XP_024520704.1 uncharacterized protein LOC112342709 [Selaginella moellendorffii]